MQTDTRSLDTMVSLQVLACIVLSGHMARNRGFEVRQVCSKLVEGKRMGNVVAVRQVCVLCVPAAGVDDR